MYCTKFCLFMTCDLCVENTPKGKRRLEFVEQPLKDKKFYLDLEGYKKVSSLAARIQDLGGVNSKVTLSDSFINKLSSLSVKYLHASNLSLLLDVYLIVFFSLFNLSRKLKNFLVKILIT